jgi:phosphoribosylformimino-5-aminoimidazole carboxamide ribotide isomerase
VTDRWQKFTDLEVNGETLSRLAEYCAEFLVHGVDVEGLQCGIMEDLVALLGEHAAIPVTYAGGASTLADLERVRGIGRGRVDLTIGSALDIFGGKLEYAEVVAWDARQAAALR